MNSQPLRCLHIAPQNISDVPMTLVRAERALGMDSRLVTFFPDSRQYPEDVCLNLPLLTSRWVQWAKKRFAPAQRQVVDNVKSGQRHSPPVWQPKGLPEKALIALREAVWQPRLRRQLKKIDFWNFDVYEFDAGLDFFRDGRTVKRLKQMGKKVIVAYTGSDFRTRGVIRPVDERADLRITFEWDHLDLDPTLVHCLFPFEPKRFAFRVREPGSTWRIGHAPTHRAAKGSDQILAVLQNLQASHSVEVVLIENLPHPQALALKETCDIFIDQIGDLGYGINALEAIAMGIPTCTSLVPAFKAAYPDHPFVEVNADNLQQQLLFLMAHADRRLALSRKGRAWVESVHDSRKIVQKIHQLLASSPTHEAPQLG